MFWVCLGCFGFALLVFLLRRKVSAGQAELLKSVLLLAEVGRNSGHFVLGFMSSTPSCCEQKLSLSESWPFGFSECSLSALPEAEF